MRTKLEMIRTWFQVWGFKLIRRKKKKKSAETGGGKQRWSKHKSKKEKKTSSLLLKNDKGDHQFSLESGGCGLTLFRNAFITIAHSLCWCLRALNEQIWFPSQKMNIFMMLTSHHYHAILFHPSSYSNHDKFYLKSHENHYFELFLSAYC